MLEKERFLKEARHNVQLLFIDIRKDLKNKTLRGEDEEEEGDEREQRKKKGPGEEMLCGEALHEWLTRRGDHEKKKRAEGKSEAGAESIRSSRLIFACIWLATNPENFTEYVMKVTEWEAHCVWLITKIDNESEQGGNRDR